MDERYEPTEKDIESVINYMRIFHPENASREYVVELLDFMKAGYHRLAFTDPDALDDLYEAFEKSRKTK